VFCQAGYGFPVPVKNPQLCGENGKWTYQHDIDTPPHCSRIDEVNLLGIVTTEFEYEGQCHDLTDKDKEEIREQSRSDLMERICRNRCDGFLVDVSRVTCGELSDDYDGESLVFRKRQAVASTSIKIDLTFTVENIGAFAINATNQSTIEDEMTEKIQQLLLNVSAVLSTEPMRLSLQNGTKSLIAIPNKVSHTLPTKRCSKPGQTLKGLTCMNCPPGTHLDGETAECAPCLEGTYQDQEAADRCTPCPYNQYQPGTGQTSCVACSNGTFTSVLGSTHNSSCKLRCNPEECYNGFQCDHCDQCVEQNGVCDGQVNCKDGTDELGCATCNKTCSSHALEYDRICHADFAFWMMVNKISPSPRDTIISSIIYSLPSLQHNNSLDLTSSNLHLDGVSQACHCSQLSHGQQYFVTAYNSPVDNKIMLTEDSIVAEWNADVKKTILSLGGCQRSKKS
jgi:hypothetical protein